MAYMKDLVGYCSWPWTAVLVLTLFLYPATVWIYNLFFHRLAHFSGPILWRASRLPYMHAAWSGHFPYVVQELHEEYGDVVRTAPDELSFRNAAAWDDIYSNANGAKAFSKGEIWHGNPEGGPASVFNTRDLKKHARIRRFMDPAFSDRAVLRQEPILHMYVDLCIEKLHERCSANQGKATVNIIDWLNFTMLDIIGDLAFGESFDCLEKSKYEAWMDNMGGAIKQHYLSLNLRHYPIISTILKPLQGLLIPKEAIRQRIDYHRRAAAKLDRRLKSNADRPDIVSQLLRSDDRADGLTPDEVMLNCMLFINAASETTVTTLTGLFNHLIQNPVSLSDLIHEIRQFASMSDLTISALKNLPYLNAVLKEALRMCGPTPVGNVRVTPPEGGIVNGQYVAGNIMVTVPQIALSFSADNFHDPHAWHPERWLQEAQTDLQSPFHRDQRKAVRAFGVGPYNCVGEPLAWAQMRLIVAKLVWAFDMTRADTANAEIAWETQPVYGIIFKHPLDVTLVERTV